MTNSVAFERLECRTLLSAGGLDPTFGKGGLNAEFRDADWEKIRTTIYGDATHKQS